MVLIHTERHLAAPPERVWAVLTDFAAYPAWNPFLRSLELKGPLQLGTKIAGRASVSSRSDRTLGIFGRIVLCEPARGLGWAGGVPGLFFGRHTFELTPKDGGTHLVHAERFTGLLTLVAGGAVKKLQAKYEELNEALAKHA